MPDKFSVFLATLLPSKEKNQNSLQFRGEKCLNCEHPLDKSDHFCPQCSQLNSTKKLHFKELISEFFGNIFSYDSRLMLTMRVLLFRPGTISKDYIAGKRMRYANPFRFYLSVSIVFFLINGALNKINEYSNNSFEKFNESEKPKNIKTSNDPETASVLDEVFKTNSFSVSDSLNTNSSTLNYYNKDTVVYYSEVQLDTMYRGQRFYQKVSIYNDFYKKNKAVKPQQALDEIGHEKSTFNLWLYKKVIDFDFFITNPNFANDFFMSRLPIVIFLFLPIFALFIKLLYIRKNRFTYMEHLIFTFHVQSLFFVLFIFSVVFDFVFSTDLFSNIALLLFIFYLYKAMRRFYGQGRFKTFVKFMILNTLFITLATFAGVGYALISFSVY